MPGIADQIRELVRSATNHARRIRRLETLQAPLAVARPQGGHIIQDEGIDLNERVYLNFVGVRIEASDDPENGVTIITVSDPDDDDFCRVTPLDVGWQINAGTESRYMKHSTAFQLDDGGDTRGDYAIDLQQDRNNVAQIAAADYSAILSGRRNELGVAAIWSTITGSSNAILDSSAGCHVLGQFNDIYNDSYGVIATGDGHDIDDALCAFFSGDSHATSITGAASLSGLGVFSFIEQNEFIGTLSGDYPTYTGSFGLSLVQRGDVWYGFQFGEDCEIYGLISGSTNNMQYGYNHYSEEAFNVFQFGYATKSVQASGVDFYDGRIVWSGDWPNASPSDGTGWPGGYNQDSLFSQNDNITTWNVAWTTSRFEFPIIQESVWGFTAYITGTERFAANVYYWKVEGLIENAGGATTLKWSVVTNIFRDVATKEWQVVADDPNDRLVFQFRDTAGPDATICNIQLMLLTIEVGYN